MVKPFPKIGYLPAYPPAKKVYIISIGLKQNMGVDTVNKSLEPEVSFNDTFIGGELEAGQKPIPDEIETSKMFKDAKILYPHDFLNLIESHIPSRLVSKKNITEIKNLANNFSNCFTSFFGFESKLNSDDSRSDYLIAVSSQKGEREALSKLINSKRISDKFLNQNAWKNIGKFVESWSDPNSVLSDKILGLWLEFDTADRICEAPIPSIFLQTVPLAIEKPEDIKKCLWVTRNAIPVVSGQQVSKKIEERFIDSIKKLPKGASVFHVASMLSRNSEGIRMVIKRIKPDDITPYLKSIGWKDENEGLTSMINEVKKFSNCIRLHINISNNIDPKIGLECFISPDQYHHGNRWEDFLNYLVSKGLCKPEMKSALLDFPGVDLENIDYEFSLDSYIPSVKLQDDNFMKAIVKYISHVKITYVPNGPINAKGYTGVRLFGKPIKAVNQ